MSLTCDRSVVFSVYSTNKTDHHDITEILLKVALDTINQTLIACVPNKKLWNMSVCLLCWKSLYLFMQYLFWYTTDRKPVLNLCNKMRKKNHHRVWTIPTPNRKIIERVITNTPNKHIHDRSIFWIDIELLKQKKANKS